MIINEKKIIDHINLLIKGRDALITSIIALQMDFFVVDLEDLRDEVNRKIKLMKSEIDK